MHMRTAKASAQSDQGFRCLSKMKTILTSTRTPDQTRRCTLGRDLYYSHVYTFIDIHQQTSFHMGWLISFICPALTAPPPPPTLPDLFEEVDGAYWFQVVLETEGPSVRSARKVHAWVLKFYISFMDYSRKTI